MTRHFEVKRLACNGGNYLARVTDGELIRLDDYDIETLIDILENHDLQPRERKLIEMLADQNADEDMTPDYIPNEKEKFADNY